MHNVKEDAIEAIEALLPDVVEIFTDASYKNDNIGAAALINEQTTLRTRLLNST